MPSLPEGCQYLTRGGESEIYLAPDHLHVIKVNDAFVAMVIQEIIGILALVGLVNFQ